MSGYLGKRGSLECARSAKACCGTRNLANKVFCARSPGAASEGQTINRIYRGKCAGTCPSRRLNVMKIIRVFPRRTSMTPDDDMAFVGEPPLIRPDADEVHVSCSFTWDIQHAKHLALAWGQYYPVKIGGVAFSSPPTEFIPGRYIKQGVTFTSRGCNNNCSFCLVRGIEGPLKPLENFPNGWIIQDNNFAQCPKEHRYKVYRMLDKQKQDAEFRGGIQASLVSDEFAEEMKAIRVKILFLACDHDSQIEQLKKAADKLSFLGHRRLFCYTLIAENGISFRELLRNRRRLGEIWGYKVTPFAQLFQPPEKWIDYPITWKHFARNWSRPAIIKGAMRKV